MPDLLGDADHFARDVRTPIERDGNEQRLEALRGRIGPYVLRRIKEHVVRDLPPKTEIVRPVELEGPQRDLYETIRVAAHADVRRMIRAKGLAASTITLLDALLKLRQICCDPRLVSMPSARDVTASAKFDALFSLLDRQLAQGRSVLVFSQFTHMLSLIGAGLRERALRYVELTGSTHDRQRPVDDFQNGEVSLFLISLKAGGTGLNLTRADTVVHYDPWWNAAAQAQATDRAYRIGQTKPVFVYKLIVSGSVEERMLMLQERKQRLSDTLFGAAGGRLSADEIDDLFAPLPE
jgi:SNF2 family DNA or RNA helicase